MHSRHQRKITRARKRRAWRRFKREATLRVYVDLESLPFPTVTYDTQGDSQTYQVIPQDLSVEDRVKWREFIEQACAVPNHRQNHYDLNYMRQLLDKPNG